MLRFAPIAMTTTTNMKTTLRLPTQDQYAFIEIEAEVSSAEDAVVAYYDAMKLIKPQEGLDTKTWNASLDEFNNTGTLKNGTELYQLMNPYQKFYFQEQKKSLKRIKADQE